MFFKMLRSDWLILTSLLRDLQTILVVLDRLVVSAELLQSDADVAVRPALAGLVAKRKNELKLDFQILRCDRSGLFVFLGQAGHSEVLV
jgi:hypothetical protein